MLDKIKDQIGSNQKKGWPVAVRDRISFPHSKDLRVTDSNFAVTFLWTMRDAVLPHLEKENLAIATNFYTPSGLEGMVRNILANPYIKYIILMGEEYASKDGEETKTELTAANAIRSFFKNGINEQRQIQGFETAIHFDEHIPTEMINKVRENVQLIDLNTQMPTATLQEKIQKANDLMRNPKQSAFLDQPQTFDYKKQEQAFPYEGGPIIVHGSNIPDSWVKMIHAIDRYGIKNLMNANTDRRVKEINNMTVVIHNPQNMDLTINPFLIPLTKEKIEAYKEEILSPILPEGKAYTYGNKLRAYETPSAPIKDLVNTTEYRDYEFGKGPWIDANVNYKGETAEVNQIKDIIDVLKKDPYSKACVAITWNVQDELMKKHKSSPCLVLIQAMVQDEKLNLYVFFRSHDMTQGWPENAYGCAAIQKEIADGIGVETGELTIVSGSAQIYAHYYEQVKEMLKKYYKYQDCFGDLRGSYTIKVDNKITVKLLHPQNHQELETIKGTTAKEVYTQLSEKGTSINPTHLLYLGSELGKAEFALKNNLQYTQDQDIIIEKQKTEPTQIEKTNQITGILSDTHIKEKLANNEIIIEGIKSESISGASADLTLGKRFRLFKNADITHVDSANINLDKFTEITEKESGEPFIIHPGEFVLGEIVERVKLPDNIMARLDGKSSLGRLGIIVHSTAGNVDPGWDGNLTLEITNISRMPVALWPGRKVAQLTFMPLSSKTETPYRKKRGNEWNQPLGSKKAV